MPNIFEEISKLTLIATVILVPLAVLSIFPNFFITPKLLILVIAVLVLLLTKIGEIITSGKLSLRVSTFDFPLLLITAAYLASALLATPNKMEAFLLPGTATVVVSSVFIYFFANQLETKNKNSLLTAIVAAGVLTAIISLLNITKVFDLIPQLPLFIKNPGFTTLGGNLAAVIFLGIITPITIKLVAEEENLAKKLFFVSASVVVTIGLLANLYQVLPGKPTAPKFPGYSQFWGITVDTLKVSPLLGAGPGNYLTAFNRFRSLEYNQTEFWNFKFTNASSFALTLLTETGLIGLAGLLLLVIAALKHLQSEQKATKDHELGIISKPELISLLLALLAIILTIATPSIIMIAFVILAINSKTKTLDTNLSAQGAGSTHQLASRSPALLVTLPVLIFCGYVILRAANIVSAEYTFKKSLDALAQNDGNATYQLMSSAIQKNPQVDRYRASFAQVNFALANAIAQDPQGEDGQVSEEQRASITQLVQQAIAEGKAAVALNPPRAGNWQILGQIYRSIMPFAQGADQFALQTYNQAVALDPVNTELRISLGGIYFALGDYDSAIDVFKLAVLTKPDHPNARYNLAVAYREKGEIDKAIAEITIVVSLLDKNSADYQIAKDELAALEAKKPTQAETTGGEELVPPQEAEEPVIEPPIELPEEAEPPSGPEEITPEPSPAELPTTPPTPSPVP